MKKLLKSLRNKKGQLSITNIITLIITVIVYVSLLPLFMPFIQSGITELDSVIAQFLLGMIPLMIILGLIQTLFMMSEGRYMR